MPLSLCLTTADLELAATGVVSSALRNSGAEPASAPTGCLSRTRWGTEEQAGATGCMMRGARCFFNQYSQDQLCNHVVCRTV